jgi:DegV family protein with EDD domain
MENKKIAIVTDSNSGILAEEFKDQGVYVIPMPFLVNGEPYLENITLSQEKFYELLGSNASVSTSQPSIGDLMELWDALLKEYDQLLHIPMSSGLSQSCATASTLAKDYNGKVLVIDNKRISVTLKESVLEAVKLRDAGKTAEEIKDYLESTSRYSSIYIAVDTMKYLKKGGRISKTVALAGSVLNIKPVLSVIDGEIAMLGKARGSKMGNNLLVQEIDKAGGIDFNKPVLLGYSGISDALLLKYIEDSRFLWENNLKEVRYTSVCSVIGTHAGPGAVVVAFFKR